MIEKWQAFCVSVKSREPRLGNFHEDKNNRNLNSKTPSWGLHDFCRTKRGGEMKIAVLSFFRKNHIFSKIILLRNGCSVFRWKLCCNGKSRNGKCSGRFILRKENGVVSEKQNQKFYKIGMNRGYDEKGNFVNLRFSRNCNFIGGSFGRLKFGMVLLSGRGKKLAALPFFRKNRIFSKTILCAAKGLFCVKKMGL